MLQIVNLSVRYQHFHHRIWVTKLSHMCQSSRCGKTHQDCSSFFAEYVRKSATAWDNMVSLRKGYYKSIGTHHYFIVNEFVVICEQISGAIRLCPNVTF